VSEVERNSGTDNLSAGLRLAFARGANRAYPSRLPPPTADVVKLQLARLRRRLLDTPNGLGEGIPL
jgi:hypothetical protein